jgi:hypothetical protein
MVAVIVVGIALVVPVAGAVLVRSAYFETPSRNIVCGYFSGAGFLTFLECGERSALRPVPPQPSEGNCAGRDLATDRIRLGETGTSYGFCSADVGVLAQRGIAPVLHYGRTWHHGPFRCSLTKAGLTCKNRNGQGFFLGPTSWQPLPATSSHLSDH